VIKERSPSSSTKDQVEISPTFYEQLLHLQIPKKQNNINDLAVFFVLLGSARVKASSKHVDEIDNRWKFGQKLETSVSLTAF
jgi:hypothetical protein